MNTLPIDKPAGRHAIASSGLQDLLHRGEPVAYALLRVGFAVILFTHGFPKIFGSALERTVGNIDTKLNLPFPWAWGYMIGTLETLGMVLLAIGFGTRLIASMVFVEMLVIIFGVLWPTWVWYKFGIEYPLLMALLALYMCFRGSGRYSVDRLRGIELGGLRD